MRPVSIEHASFSGHETFPLRMMWLPKAVENIRKDADLFTREDALVRLGVGKNMVKSMRHWALACGVLEEHAVEGSRLKTLSVSDLGEKLFGSEGWDPYLEDAATPWLLHWELSARPERATTWFWVFNHCPQPEFTKDELVRWLLTISEQTNAKRTSEASLRRDIDVFLRSYVAGKPSRSEPIEESLECPLVELELIREYGQRGTYLLQRADQPTLPDAVFAYALGRFIGHSGKTARTLALEEVAYAPGSPGRVFCLSEDALLLRLDAVEAATNGGIVFDETAGMRQLLIKHDLDPMKLLGNYYGAAAKQLAS
jgi:hypothetical protein